MLARPRIRPSAEAFDVVLEALAVGFFVAVVVCLAALWPRIPASVPSHFGINGRPDAWGGKSSLIVIAATLAAVNILLTIATRFPWTFNYPIRVDEGNALRVYAIGTRLLRLVKAIVSLCFAWLIFASVALARSPESAGLLNVVFAPITIASLIGTLIWASVALRKARA